MAKISKNLTAAYASFDKTKAYSIEDAVALIKKISTEKFDPTVEASFNLNLDTTQAEQQLRGSIVLPNGTGRSAKVLVIGEQADQDVAKAAGADHVGSMDIMEKVAKDNWFDFEFIVTTPAMMPKLAKYGRLLGPKGLMPNPKLGTVTTDIASAVENIKKGQLEYRTDKEGVISLSIGKKSFTDKALIENFTKINDLIKSLRPRTLKGTYINNVSISTTMGPGVKVSGQVK